MKVRVTIGGLLTKPGGKSRVDAEVSDGATISDLLAAIGYSPEHIPRIMPSVKGTIRKHDYALSDGDEVSLSILVGGG